MSLAVMLFFTISIALNVLLIRSNCRLLWSKIFRRGRNKKGESDPNEFENSRRNLILLKIQNAHVEELVTLRQRFKSVIVDSDCRKVPGTNINIPGTGRLFVATYEGEVAYGNDLSKITISEPVGVNKVKIIVPHSRVLDSYPDLKSLKVILDNTGFFADKKLAQHTKRLQADVDEICKTAIDNGMLEQADRNTAIVLQSLVASTGLESEILFIDAPDEADKIAAPDASLQINERADALSLNAPDAAQGSRASELANDNSDNIEDIMAKIISATESADEIVAKIENVAKVEKLANIAKLESATSESAANDLKITETVTHAVAQDKNESQSQSQSQPAAIAQ